MKMMNMPHQILINAVPEKVYETILQLKELRAGGQLMQNLNLKREVLKKLLFYYRQAVFQFNIDWLEPGN
jgi:hypothetical protein